MYQIQPFQHHDTEAFSVVLANPAFFRPAEDLGVDKSLGARGQEALPILLTDQALLPKNIEALCIGLCRSLRLMSS